MVCHRVLALQEDLAIYAACPQLPEYPSPTPVAITSVFYVREPVSVLYTLSLVSYKRFHMVFVFV